MAQLMYCPNCKTSREATKKGKNSAGEQLYVCKTCNKRFTEDAGTLPVNKNSKPKKTIENKVSKKAGKTKIYVNNNIIKEVDDILSADQAFALVTNYFREVTKDAVQVSDVDGIRTIKFVIEIGRKGH